jgi:asparagine synthase (glutamine-hydrolysing)
MAPFMPEGIAYRQAKIGFSAPIVDWLRGPLKEFCLDSIHSQAFRQCALIDPKQVAAQITRVIEESAPRFDQAEIAWAKLSPFLWEQAMARHCPNFARSVQ